MGMTATQLRDVHPSTQALLQGQSSMETRL